jgi:calcium/calmodulin-dependent protein kinase I
MEKSKLTPEDKAALTVEIESMKRLSDHDCFVKLYEFYDEAEKYMLVLELISGGELFDRIVEKEKYSEREARRVIRQLSEAMAYAHSKGIAHRDLKPENVLLRDRDDDTGIKIADFGFAKIIVGDELMKTPCGYVA